MSSFVSQKNNKCVYAVSSYTNLLGLACLIGWCLFSAFARVLTSHISQHLSPTVLCFYTFFVASFVFVLINAKNSRNTLNKLKEKKNLYDLAWLNLTTFGAWFFLIYPLKYIEPSVVSTITLGLSPIATLLLGYFIHKKTRASAFDVFITAFLFAIIIYTAILCLNGIALLSNISLLKTVYALAACFIVGIATAAGNLYAKKLSDSQFEPVEILATRFWLTVLLAGVLMLVLHEGTAINESLLGDVLIVSLSLVIIPLYLAQIAIKHLEPITVAIVAPFMPVTVFLFEWMGRQIHPSPWTFLSTITISALVLASVFIKYWKIRWNKDN